MNQLIKIFKALSDTNRVRILKMLEIRPLCVCEITTVLGLAMSTVSKHLSILRDANLIFEQKEGKWVNYYLNTATQQQYIKKFIPLIRQWLHEDHQIIKDSEKVRIVNREIICRA